MFRTLVLCCLLPIITAIGISKTELPNKGLPNTGMPFQNDISNLLNDPVLSPMELAQNAGYKAESYEVVTQDGYILEMHRLESSSTSSRSTNKTPVLLLHGLLDCSVTWIAAGYMLVDQGYDVWLGNVRGNRFSRKHSNLTTSDAEFWMFSWNEMGMYDLPAMIDHITMETKQEKIFMVTHSQGGTAFFVMASERPEYQEKIIALSALAPAVFMSRVGFSLLAVSSIATVDNNLISRLPVHDIQPSGKLLQTVGRVICSQQSPLWSLCKNLFDLFFGYDGNFIESTLGLMSQYDPAGASIRQFAHYGQSVISGKFRKFDYGAAGNMKNYGQEQPPDYNLGNVSVPVALYYGTNDVVTVAQDIQELYETLPNGQKSLIQTDTYAHLDFVWGKKVNTLVYDKILNFMEQYRE
ncbi:hypothetical protein QLX08_007897 [Tetragonisca angustula]|uniref:Lipase n=1 Tax=Tetragonisca angustula TaxID=166442 RepID=A0AAW0ZPF1_9HYME